MSRVIIIYACPVLNQIRACHYAYVRFRGGSRGSQVSHATNVKIARVN